MLRADSGNFFEFVTIGEFFSDNEWIHPSRSIDSHEIIFVLEGRVCIEENGIRYTLNPNDILLLEPFVPHSGFEISAPPTSFYWFHFRTDMDIPCKLYKGREIYDIKYLLKKLLHISNTPSYTKSAADAAGLLILEELLRQGSFPNGSSLALAHKIAEYARINITDITVAKSPAISATTPII